MKRAPVILLVEDNDDHAELITRCLTREPLQVIRCRHGDDALAYLNRDGEYRDPGVSPWPTVIVLDLRMPRQSGFEVLARVKEDERLQTIPVVVFTSSSAPEDIARAYELHANSYLVKPTEIGALIELVESLRAYWTRHSVVVRDPGDRSRA